MPSTYTTNTGIEKIATGEQSGTWGDTTNTNWDLVDEAINGIVTVTLASAGTSGSPNTLAITDGASSNGRNKFIEFTDGGDLGATAYVQLTPNDAEKIAYIRNSLSGSRDLIIFQGTYNASNDYTLPAGKDALLKFDGAGSGAVVEAVLADQSFTNISTTSTTTTNLTATGTITFNGATVSDLGTVTTADINGGTIDGTNIGASSAGTGNFSTLSIGGVAITATPAELNLLDGVPAGLTTTEIGYLDGVTSSIQAQLDSISAGGVSSASEGAAGIAELATQTETNTGTDDARIVTPLKLANYTGITNKAPIASPTFTGTATIPTVDINGGAIDGTNIGAAAAGTGNFTTLSINGVAITSTAAELNKLDTVTVGATEFNYLSGLTSNVQDQLNSISAGGASSATATSEGLVELATQTEVNNGTASPANLVVTPPTLASYTGITNKAPIASPTFTGTVTIPTVDINGGAIDGTNIGATTPGTGNFSTLSISGTAITVSAAEINYLDNATGNIQSQLDGKADTANETFTGTTIINTINCDGGAIDGTTVGATTPSTGAFTSLSASLTATFSTVDINGGAIDGVTIGGASAGAGTFTNLTSTGTSTHATVDINGGAIDGTPIGASSASTGAFTTLSASGAATFAAEIVEATNTVAQSTGTLTLDPVNGTIQSVTLSQDVTTVTYNIADGEFVTLLVDDGTAYTIDFGGTILWVGGSAPSLDATNITVIEIWKVGTALYGALVGVAS